MPEKTALTTLKAAVVVVGAVGVIAAAAAAASASSSTIPTDHDDNHMKNDEGGSKDNAEEDARDKKVVVVVEEEKTQKPAATDLMSISKSLSKEEMIHALCRVLPEKEQVSLAQEFRCLARKRKIPPSQDATTEEETTEEMAVDEEDNTTVVMDLIQSKMIPSTLPEEYKAMAFNRMQNQVVAFQSWMKTRHSMQEAGLLTDDSTCCKLVEFFSDNHDTTTSSDSHKSKAWVMCQLKTFIIEEKGIISWETKQALEFVAMELEGLETKLGKLNFFRNLIPQCTVVEATATTTSLPDDPIESDLTAVINQVYSAGWSTPTMYMMSLLEQFPVLAKKKFTIEGYSKRFTPLEFYVVQYVQKGFDPAAGEGGKANMDALLELYTTREEKVQAMKNLLDCIWCNATVDNLRMKWWASNVVPHYWIMSNLQQLHMDKIASDLALIYSLEQYTHRTGRDREEDSILGQLKAKNAGLYKYMLPKVEAWHPTTSVFDSTVRTIDLGGGNLSHLSLSPARTNHSSNAATDPVDLTPLVLALLDLPFLQSLRLALPHSRPLHYIDALSLCEAIKKSSDSFKSLTLNGPELRHHDDDARQIPTLLFNAVSVFCSGTDDDGDNNNNNNNNNNRGDIPPKQLHNLIVRVDNKIIAAGDLAPYLKAEEGVDNFIDYDRTIKIWIACTMNRFHFDDPSLFDDQTHCNRQSFLSSIIDLLINVKELPAELPPPPPRDDDSDDDSLFSLESQEDSDLDFDLEGICALRTQEELDELWSGEQQQQQQQQQQQPAEVERMVNPFHSLLYELLRTSVGSWCRESK